METITLTWSEVLLAVSAGVMRRISAIRDGRIGRYGPRHESAWDNDITGAIAEFAVAKWLNVFWSGTVGITDAPDVGPLQVRSKSRLDYRLVVRPDDSDDEIYVSVFVDIPKCTVCGWLLGKEAKQEPWLEKPKDKPAMYFIKNEFLHSPAGLPRTKAA